MKYLKDMVEEKKILQEEYDKMALPDLIKNGKGKDNKEYYQLEGALVSAVFNLNEKIEILRQKNKDFDKFMNSTFPKDLVGIALANEKQRTKIFTPFKFAVDAWIQFVNGTIDTNTYMWETNSVIDGATGATNVSVPQVGVYKDLSFFLRYWRDCDIKELRNLYINPDLKKQDGIVKMKDVVLKGNVTIANATDKELLIEPSLLRYCNFRRCRNRNI